MGCVDRLDDEGMNSCSSETRCTAPLIERCCGCGGGIKVQCYEGSECPQPPQLPSPEAGDCIQDKTDLMPTWKQKHQCVFTNACNFAVEWSCPSSRCQHTTQPGGLWIMSCNGEKETEICSRGVCSVTKASGSDVDK